MTALTTLLGTLAVMYAYFVPMDVLPFLVMQRRVSCPLVAFGKLLATSGRVQEYDVPRPVATLTQEPLPSL